MNQIETYLIYCKRNNVIHRFRLLIFASIGVRNELRKAGISLGKFIMGFVAIFVVLAGLIGS